MKDASLYSLFFLFINYVCEGYVFFCLFVFFFLGIGSGFKQSQTLSPLHMKISTAIISVPIRKCQAKDMNLVIAVCYHHSNKATLLEFINLKSMHFCIDNNHHLRKQCHPPLSACNLIPDE